MTIPPICRVYVYFCLLANIKTTIISYFLNPAKSTRVPGSVTNTSDLPDTCWCHCCLIVTHVATGLYHCGWGLYRPELEVTAGGIFDKLPVQCATAVCGIPFRARVKSCDYVIIIDCSSTDTFLLLATKCP